MTASLDIPTSTWSIMKEQAQMLVRSGFLPTAIKTPEQGMAIILKGRELGIPPMQAFAHISVIQGKPAIGAELMLALIRRTYPNAPIEIERRDNDGALIRAGRPGSKKLTEFCFTIEDAKRAGLLGKTSWQGYPRNMCFWRAISDMARSIYPECLMGCSHTPEELGAEVNEEGDVVETAPAKTHTKAVDVPLIVDATHEDEVYSEATKPALFRLAKEAGITGSRFFKLHDDCIANAVLVANLKIAVKDFLEQT